MAHLVAAEAAFWRNLRPGSRLLVLYIGDDTYHERLALWPVTEGRWVCYTPDADMYDEAIDGTDPENVLETLPLEPRGRLPPGLRNRAYRFARLPSEAELRGLIREGCAEARRICQEEGLPELTPAGVEKYSGQLVTLDDFYGGAFLERRRRRRADTPAGEPAPAEPLPAAEQRAAPAEEAAGPPTPRTPEGHVWLLAEGGPGQEAGSQVILADADLVRGSSALVEVGGVCRRAELVAVERAPAFAAAVRGSPADRTSPPGAPSADAASARGDAAAGEPGASTEDLRTLWIDYDSHGERHKAWREVAQEISTHRYDDWPLEGPLTMQHLVVHQSRYGGDPRLWL